MWDELDDLSGLKIQEYPAHLLIGPDGKLINNVTKLEELKQEVQKAVGRPHPPPRAKTIRQLQLVRLKRLKCRRAIGMILSIAAALSCRVHTSL